MSFQVHTPSTAPAPARNPLAAIEKRYGFIPNLAGVFAESPGAMKGLLSAIEAFDDAALTLDPLERQVVLLAVAAENRCGYCAAAHGMLANSMGLDRQQVARLQQRETLENERLEALRAFTAAVVANRGSVLQGGLDRFLAAGFTRGQVLEVLLGVSLKTLTNYANHIAQPPVNAQFRAFLPDWEDEGMSRRAG